MSIDLNSLSTAPTNDPQIPVPQKTGEICAICLETIFNPNVPLAVHLTGETAHVFHQACAISWLTIRPICPLDTLPFSLLDAGENTPLSRGRAVLDAVKARNVQRLKEVFHLGLISDEDRGKAVRLATLQDDIQCLETLLESGPLSGQDRDQAVIIAVSMRNVPLLRKLMESGNISDQARRRAAFRIQIFGFLVLCDSFCVPDYYDGDLRDGFFRIAPDLKEMLDILSPRGQDFLDVFLIGTLGIHVADNSILNLSMSRISPTFLSRLARKTLQVTAAALHRIGGFFRRAEQ